jgi:dihydrofolate synthase/folylpolyglutamate synthase
MTSPEDLEVLELIEAALLKRWPENKIDPSLVRIAALVDALGSPQLSYPTIHIAGTNGKSSVARMVDALFRGLDYRTGRYTSPHLHSFLERISIKGESISPEGLIATYNDIALYLDLIDSRQEFPLSYFEALTALAFVAFAEYPVDIAIIEAGMGGEWDSTNLLASSVSVITPIGIDHTEYLGETIEEIALNKSGIIKPESHVVMAAQTVEAAKVLTAQIVSKSAIPYREGLEFSLAKRDIAVGGQLISVNGIHGNYDDVFLPLHGIHQAHNAALALATVEAFVGVQLDEEIVRSAFASLAIPGRFEIVHRDPTVIVDSAHNPHGMSALAQTLEQEFDFAGTFGVLAVLGDKDVDGILAELEPIIGRLIVTANKSPRALPVEELYQRALKVFGPERTFKEADLRSALTYAMEQCTLVNQVSDASSAVIVAGSFVTAAEARVIVGAVKESS